MLKRFQIVLLFFVFFNHSIAWTQHTFHKVYQLTDTTVLFSNVKEIDSAYWVSGDIGRGSIRSDAIIVKLDLTGDMVWTYINSDSNYLNSLGTSYGEIDTNIFGQYMFHYTSYPIFGGVSTHTIGKFDAISNLYESENLDTLKNEFINYLNSPRLALNNSDSTYCTSSSYFYNSAIDTTSNLPNSIGFLVIKFSQINDSIIWLKKFSNSVLNNGTSKGRSNVFYYINDNILNISFEKNAHPVANQQFCKVIFYILDKNGGIIQTKILQDTPYSFPGFGSTFLNNQKDLLISYTSSELITPPTGPPYWGLTPSVARLDSNFNIVWKKELGGIQFNPYQISSKHMFNKFALVGDTAFVGAYFRVFYDTNFLESNGTLRMMNASLENGEINWLRDYNFYSDSGVLNNAIYEIRDIEKTNDDGFIMVGEVQNYDSLNIGAPGQLGYVLKTNCLGFLNTPQASFSSSNTDSMGVQFYNTSLMAGSYLWNFGDSTSLTTGENTDTLFHQYTAAGTYEIELIAFGCNGENDTTRFTIEVPENTTDPVDSVFINPNITNYMALGPNPVKSGESIAVYVGSLPSENCTLSFYNQQGQLVWQQTITQSKSTNIIVLPFSAGVYQAVLRNGNENLEVEKVLVY